MKPIILSTDSSAYFATRIAQQFRASELISTTRKKFGDGERYLKINLQNRLELFGRDVIIVGSTTTDDDFTEVCRVGTAAANCGARRIVFAIPFFGYSTMERAVKPGEIVTAKFNARQLSLLPHGDVRNCFFMLDLHTAGLVHYFEGECLRFELYAEPILTEAVRDLALTNFMFASADLGRPLWVETFAKHFGTSLAFVRKSRDFEETKVHEVVGDVNGKVVVIYDDMIRSSTTLIHAADAYLERGALSVYAVASHLAFNDEAAIKRLEDSSITLTIGTNSHPMSQHERVMSSPKFVVKDASQLFVNAILNLNGGRQ